MYVIYMQKGRMNKQQTVHRLPLNILYDSVDNLSTYE